MQYVMTYLVVLFVVFLIMYVTLYIIPLKKDNLGLHKSFQFIVRKYNLNMDKNRVKILSKAIVFINSFILSLALMMVLFLEINTYILFILVFVMFIILILSLYNLLGLILRKKGW